MRNDPIRRMLWLVVGILISFITLLPSTRAETIPATAVAPVPNESWTFFDGGYYTYTTKAAALAKCTATHPGWCAEMGSWSTRNASSDKYGLCQTSGANCGYSTELHHNYWCTSGTLSASGSPPRTFSCSGVGSYSCPATGGWTLSGTSCTRPDCTAGQVRLESGICTAECNSNEIRDTDGVCKFRCSTYAPDALVTEIEGVNLWKVHYVQGTGTYPTGGTYCRSMNTSGVGDSGCTVDMGDGIGSTNDNGTWNYSGRLYHTGTSCTPGASSGTKIQPESPEAKCLSSGQGYGTVSGTVVCTGTPKTTEERRETKKEVTKPDGSKGTTTTTEITTCTNGSCNTTTTTSVSGGGASGTETNGTTTGTKEEGKDAYCQEHPEETSCIQETTGDPAGTDGLYTKGEKTVASVINTFKGTVQGSGFYSAATGYFSASIPAGSCSGLSVDVPTGFSTWHIDAGTVLCGGTATTMYTLLGIGVMLAAGWVAFRIAIL